MMRISWDTNIGVMHWHVSEADVLQSVKALANLGYDCRVEIVDSPPST